MESKSVMEKYADIINLPHYISKTRPQMDIIDRAAQFSPFAALTGYEEAVKETGRLTEEFAELDESRKSILDDKLQQVFKRIKEHPVIAITYFEPDKKKHGGAYLNLVEKVKKIDMFEGCIVMENGQRILFERIYEIEEMGERD